MKLINNLKRFTVFSPERSAESAFLPKNEKGGLALLTSWRQEGVTGLLSALTGTDIMCPHHAGDRVQHF